MRLAVTGSIATDHLMSFPGRFADSLVVEQLDKISLSFLVDDLQIRRGGIAANIAFGLGNLGLNPLLVGAVGQDWRDYESWLQRHGVDTTHVHVSEVAHTARFVCTTDADHAQMASFYAGAMTEARGIELGPIAARSGGLDLVVISPNDPEAMLRHTEECRDRGIPFVADPSQQLAWMDGDQIRQLVEGAAFLFTNAYEASMIEQKTGWTHRDVLDRVDVRVITRGKDGATVETRGGDARHRDHPAGGPPRRPDGRRGRLPRRVRRRPGLGDGAASAARSSARCWRPTSWRRSGPRSTSSAGPTSSTGSPRPTATTPRPRWATTW